MPKSEPATPGPTSEHMDRRQRAKLMLPSMAVIAARIRDGESHVTIAAQYHLDKQGLANRLRHAGYRFDTGEVERDARLREMREHLQTKLLRWNEPWMGDAKCAEVGSDLWFPERGETTKDAKRVCSGCPSVDLCLQYALDNHERFGVWGGRSENERRVLTRERKKAAA